MRSAPRAHSPGIHEDVRDPDLNVVRRGRDRSLEDVPAALRTKLLESTNGLNSATILIADRKGKEELARAVRRLPGNPAGNAVRLPSRMRYRPTIRALRIAAALLALILITLILWAVCARP
jgi:hypothetical protein